MGKWLQLLKEIAPVITRVAVIFNPNTAPYAALAYPAIEGAAPAVFSGMPGMVRFSVFFVERIPAFRPSRGKQR